VVVMGAEEANLFGAGVVGDRVVRSMVDRACLEGAGVAGVVDKGARVRNWCCTR
jgi:hypothetical protein